MECQFPTARGTGGYCRGCRCRVCTDKKLVYNEKRKVKDERLRLYEKAKAGANARGILWDISLDDIVIPDKCPILGIPLYRTGGKRTDNSPSLDRIDNNVGYTKDNIHVISWRANNIKGDATLEELSTLVAYLKSL